MKKNIAMMSKVGGLGLAGAFVFGATSVSAEQFDVNVQVQNALAIDDITPMDFGTLYAATANGSAVSGISIAPNGDIGEGLTQTINGGAAGDAPPFLSLVDGAPASGSVATDATFNIIMPDALSADLDSSGWAGDDIDSPRIQLSPDTAGFYLTDFNLTEATLVQTGGTGSPQLTEVSAGTYTIDPGFNAESVQFFIGATIWTDGEGTRKTYDEALYTGTFEVTAEFQ